MSAVDQAIEGNQRYAAAFDQGHLAAPPARKLAVVTCMDARMEVPELLGLGIGDAHVIRNAGGIVTDDALRSLIISHHLLGMQEIMIINHTRCGLLSFTDDALRAQLETKTGSQAPTPSHFYGFTDLETNVREQMAKVKAHPWIPSEVSVRGFVYDIASGALTEVHP